MTIQTIQTSQPNQGNQPNQGKQALSPSEQEYTIQLAEAIAEKVASKFEEEERKTATKPLDVYDAAEVTKEAAYEAVYVLIQQRFLINKRKHLSKHGKTIARAAVLAACNELAAVVAYQSTISTQLPQADVAG